MDTLAPLLSKLDPIIGPWLATARDWATSPAAWSQFVALVLAWALRWGSGGGSGRGLAR